MRKKFDCDGISGCEKFSESKASFDIVQKSILEKLHEGTVKFWEKSRGFEQIIEKFLFKKNSRKILGGTEFVMKSEKPRT